MVVVGSRYVRYKVNTSMVDQHRKQASGISKVKQAALGKVIPNQARQAAVPRCVK